MPCNYANKLRQIYLTENGYENNNKTQEVPVQASTKRPCQNNLLEI